MLGPCVVLLGVPHAAELLEEALPRRLDAGVGVRGLGRPGGIKKVVGAFLRPAMARAEVWKEGKAMTKRAHDEVGFTVGSRNVFRDLGLESPDEELSEARLARQIHDRSLALGPNGTDGRRKPVETGEWVAIGSKAGRRAQRKPWACAYASRAARTCCNTLSSFIVWAPFRQLLGRADERRLAACRTADGLDPGPERRVLFFLGRYVSLRSSRSQACGSSRAKRWSSHTVCSKPWATSNSTA